MVEAGQAARSEGMLANTAAIAEKRDRPLRGIQLQVGAVAVFASVDSMTKHLATTWNVPLVAAVRYIVDTLALAAI